MVIDRSRRVNIRQMGRLSLNLAAVYSSVHGVYPLSCPRPRASPRRSRDFYKDAESQGSDFWAGNNTSATLVDPSSSNISISTLKSPEPGQSPAEEREVETLLDISTENVSPRHTEKRQRVVFERPEPSVSDLCVISGRSQSPY